MYAIAIVLHLLSAIVWVGGMFFAYMVLRPSAGQLLEPAQRLPLWSEVFRRFFMWVWIAIFVLLASGNWMIFGFYGGMRQAGLHIHIMNGLAWIMIALFIYLNLGPLKGLRSAVTREDWPAGGQTLGKIRQIVAINLSIGLAIVFIAGAGRYLLQ
ncbi:MAG: CopD family protein [Gammaproteobacteria bacterium]